MLHFKVPCNFTSVIQHLKRIRNGISDEFDASDMMITLAQFALTAISYIICKHFHCSVI